MERKVTLVSVRGNDEYLSELFELTNDNLAYLISEAKTEKHFIDEENKRFRRKKEKLNENYVEIRIVFVDEDGEIDFDCGYDTISFLGWEGTDNILEAVKKSISSLSVDGKEEV